MPYGVRFMPASSFTLKPYGNMAKDYTGNGRQMQAQYIIMNIE